MALKKSLSVMLVAVALKGMRCRPPLGTVTTVVPQ